MYYKWSELKKVRGTGDCLNKQTKKIVPPNLTQTINQVIKLTNQKSYLQWSRWAKSIMCSHFYDQQDRNKYTNTYFTWSRLKRHSKGIVGETMTIKFHFAHCLSPTHKSDDDTAKINALQHKHFSSLPWDNIEEGNAFLCCWLLLFLAPIWYDWWLLTFL